MLLKEIPRAEVISKLDRSNVTTFETEVRDLKVEVQEASTLIASIGGKEARFLPTARDQFLSTSRVPKSFFVNSSRDFQSEILQEKVISDQKVKVSVVDVAGEQWVRGIHAADLHVYSDLDIFNMFSSDLVSVHMIGGKSTDTKTLFRLVHPTVLPVDGEELYLGAQISNSEVGHGNLEISGVLFRPICVNGAVILKEQKPLFSTKFTEISDAIRTAFLESLISTIQGNFERVSAQITNSINQKFTKDSARSFLDDLAETKLRGTGVSKTSILQVAKAIEEAGSLETSLWEIANHLTYNAQAQEVPLKRVRMETLGANLLGLSF